MLKNILYLFLSFLLVVILSLLFVEFVFQTIPIISRTFPLSKDKVYIYIIGESSSLGEPYCISNNNISYYKILDYIIGGKIDNKTIEFIKLAHSGNSIRTQYWKYLIYRYLHPLKKGLVFVYAGKNDWDNCSNIRETKLYKIKLGTKTYKIKLGTKIYKIKLLNLLKDVVFQILQDYTFKYNYEKLILDIKNCGDDVFVATIEGNYAGFMPHLDAEDILYKEEFNKVDDEILITKNYKKAEEMLKQLEDKKDSDKSWIYYRYGKIAEFTGNVKEANDFFIKGISLYPDLIPSKYKIDCIKILAQKYNLPLVDIFNEVYNSGEIIGFNFYKDNQHPDIKLYIKIARLFANALKDKYGDKINIEKENITENDIFKYFGFNDGNMYDVYRHSLDVTLVHSKEKDNTNRYVFKQVEKYLNNVIELNPYDGEQKQAVISFYSMMVEALKGNKERMFEIYSKNKNIIENNKYNIYARDCDWKEYNNWVSNYLGIENFFDLSKSGK